MVIATVVVDMQVEPSHSPQDIEKEVESSVDEEKDMAMVLSLFGVEDLNLGDPDEGIPLGGRCTSLVVPSIRSIFRRESCASHSQMHRWKTGLCCQTVRITISLK